MPNIRFSRARSHAIKRGLTWQIEKDDFAWLCSLDCYYCDGFFKAVEAGSGLDRIDNKVGYTLQNVVACCQLCNRTKSSHFSLDETKAMISTVIALRREAA